ncbi:hypothetical protein [Mesorhizobium sp.]|nr:hypothetical protein [Mesorhizobium sp.]
MNRLIPTAKELAIWTAQELLAAAIALPLSFYISAVIIRTIVGP